MDFFWDSKKTFQETLIIPVNVFVRDSQKSIRNEGFHRYFNKVHKIKSAYKGSLHQWSQGVLFAMYTCNAGPVDRNDIARSVVAIGREFPFPIELSQSRSREGNE